ncbi:MAG: hypothetical protein HFF69_07485 [Oscillospiraceae bacterium]|nr:hypothetical protein [Oscillospiraceae bacterium]
MITAKARRSIDQAIKQVWLKDIREDYGRGRLLREASLQSSLYHHLRSCLEDVLNDNSLFIYPEFYVPDLRYRADLAIVKADLSAGGELSGRVSDIAAIIELKFEGGTARCTENIIKADLRKLKRYARQLGRSCQFYFGVIYETECVWLNWLDRRSTEHWADGCVTELNAGYIGGVMTFEVNSYNHMGIRNQSAACRMLW